MEVLNLVGKFGFVQPNTMLSRYSVAYLTNRLFRAVLKFCSTNRLFTYLNYFFHRFCWHFNDSTVGSRYNADISSRIEHDIIRFCNLLKPNLVRDIFERALELLKRMHGYTRNDHGRCGQFHVRSHALESRSGFYSQALTSSTLLLSSAVGARSIMSLTRLGFRAYFTIDLSFV